MQLRPVLPVVAVVVGMAAGLSGCGRPDDNPMGLPSLDSVAATASSHPVTAAGAPSAGPARSGSAASATPSGVGAAGTAGTAGAELGRLTGSARGRRDVVQAVVDYMDVRVRIANTWQVDRAALAAVATGRAARAASDRAGEMSQGQRRAVGFFVVNASRVRVSGDRASVTGCMVDRTSEVDAAGQVLVDPPGGRLATMKLVRGAGGWRVSDVPHGVPPFCSAPPS